MTTQEIYKLASEITAQEIQNVLGGFNSEETTKFNQLIKLGDSEGISLFTVIAEKYNAVEVSEMYNIAYKS